MNKHNQNNNGESLLKLEADQGISFNKYKNYRNGDSNNFINKCVPNHKK